MTNVQVNDVLAAALNAKAAAQGLTVQAYLETVLFSSLPVPAPRLSVDELEHLLDEEATVGPSPSGGFSRGDLYRDHD
jgi:hypothetical protein